MDRVNVQRLTGIVVTTVLLAACAAPASSPGQPSGSSSASSQATPQKTSAILAVSAVIPALSWAYAGTSSGGAYSFAELYMQGLVTTGMNNTAPEPRIAAEIPSLDRGTAQVNPDGTMRVTWKIRPDVKWADGVDLTAKDYAFGFELLKDRNTPLPGATTIVNIGPMVDSLEVVDDKTFVMNWNRPFYQFDSMGFLPLQPIPTHLLRSIWDERNADALLNHPYWRGDYFQVGPYRPIRFEPQVELVLQAVPGYFLGKPKLDTITIKQFGDANALYAALLAKTIDLTADNALQPEQAVELRAQWERSGEGMVFIGYGTSRGIFPQFSAEYQTEPGMLDPRVRQALYAAVDRESWTGVALGGLKENTAYSLLPPDHPLFDFTKDSLRSSSYDVTKANRMFADLGWTRGGDGILTNREGRRFRVDAWTTQDNENEATILSDMWKQVGVESPVTIIPNAQVDNRELRQSYSGIEISARGYGDSILTRAECSTGSAPPRYAGSNRGHYCNPQMDDLIEKYRASITRAEQGRTITDIARLHAQDLPMMQLYFNLSHPTVIRGFNALANDWTGGIQAGGYYGSYFRNAHLWEWS